ncbi:MAG: UDP-N-acetylmuramoyl-L-alanine--D-glutamate ligase [Alphaproteobacteria bacterium]
MIEVTKYQNKRVSVYGLGKTGAAAIRSLIAGGAQVIAWDDDPIKRANWLNNIISENIIQNFDKILTDLSSENWKKIDILLLTPGIPLEYPEPHPIVKFANSINCPIISDVELLYQTCFDCKYIGITGTNGKSTTTSLIGHIFKQNSYKCEIGGNIGIPVLELEPLSNDAAYILEVSSYQLDMLKEVRFNTAILLNITPDHLEYHNNIENYTKAKMKIFANHQEGDSIIISIDNDITFKVFNEIKESTDAVIIPISTDQIIKGGVTVIENDLYDFTDLNKSEPVIYKIDNTKNLAGKHNKENIAAAYAACLNYIQDPNSIISGINSFRGLAHRMEFLGEINNMRFINDSKATNADAAEKALLTYDNIYWIIGGLSKEGGISDLKKYFTKIKHAFLIGQAQDEFAKTLDGSVQFTKSGNLEQAFKDAVSLAEKDNNTANILLSPACASWDQWQSFEARGEGFRKLFTEYKEKAFR